MKLGEGYLVMDIALFMMALGAALMQFQYLPSRFATSVGAGLVSACRVAGWASLSARFGSVLFTTGDIMVSVPAAIGIMFLAAAEIFNVFNRGVQVKL